MARRLTTEEFIKKAKEVHGDRYDYSLTEYKKSNVKVTIICPIHGEFKQKPNGHLSNKGCSECAGHNKTTEKFIKESKEIHDDKYDYSLVKYINSKTDVKIICPVHGEFKQNPSIHISQKCGCPDCATERTIKSLSSTTDEFIKKSRKIHGDRYDYSLVDYVNSLNNVKIICSVHGEFEQLPPKHLSGSGCKYCANNIKSTSKEFIKKSHEIYGDKYDYSSVDYKTTFTNVIISDEFGKCSVRPYAFLKGCGLTIRSAINKTDYFIKKSRKIHSDKYNYSKVDYKTNFTNVTIICPIHGEFEQSPNRHTNQESGCPLCAPERIKKTMIERYGRGFFKIVPKYNPHTIFFIDELSEKTNINFEHALNGGERIFHSYAVDAYNEEYNIVIEFDEKHHNLQKEKDEQRQQYIVDNFGCNFIRVDWKQFINNTEEEFELLVEQIELLKK